MSTDEPQVYRFAPLDQTGWILGLSGLQCALIGATILVATVAAQLGAPPALLAIITVAGIGITVGRWAGLPLHEWVPMTATHHTNKALGKARWVRPLSPAAAQASTAGLPSFLADAGIRDVGVVTWTHDRQVSLGVIEDAKGSLLSGTIRVAGSGFSLAAPGDQDRALAMWGSALAAACREQTPLASIRVTESVAAGQPRDHRTYAETHTADNADSHAVSSYDDLLAGAAPPTTHEVLLTVTVDARRLRRHRRNVDRGQAAIEVVADELRQLAQRLDAAGLHASPPLTAGDLALIIRTRCDPTARARLTARHRSLAQLAAQATVDPTPLATEVEWDHVRVDGAIHRSYWIAEWPRLDVHANWLETLLLHPGGPRTLTVDYEPVTPSRSRRAIDRDATRLATDEEQRTRSGFRVGARHHRSQRAVADRETELVAGYAEFEYVGILTITATSLDELDASSLDFEQAAAQSGLELRPLHGRQHHALACSLPTPSGLHRRIAW